MKLFKNSCRDENAWIFGGAGKHFRRDSIAIAEKILACSAQKTAFTAGKEFLNNFYTLNLLAKYIFQLTQNKYGH